MGYEMGRSVVQVDRNVFPIPDHVRSGSRILMEKKSQGVFTLAGIFLAGARNCKFF